MSMSLKRQGHTVWHQRWPAGKGLSVSEAMSFVKSLMISVDVSVCENVTVSEDIMTIGESVSSWVIVTGIDHGICRKCVGRKWRHYGRKWRKSSIQTSGHRILPEVERNQFGLVFETDQDKSYCRWLWTFLVITYHISLKISVVGRIIALYCLEIIKKRSLMTLLTRRLKGSSQRYATKILSFKPF